MKRLAILAASALVAMSAAAQEAASVWPAKKTQAAATVVVFNNADSISVALAGYYAEKRGIPFNHLVGLDCSSNEEITREEYDLTIAEPLRKAFREHGWWREPADAASPVTENKIRYVVLMRGVPLKIASVIGYAGDSFDGQPALNQNYASVDSELTVLGLFTRKISGPINNPYYRSFTPFAEFKNPALMLVCRLDAPTGDLVRRMIDDALATEQRELWGFVYIDARSIADPGLAEGDKWMFKIADEARSHGFPVILDRVEAQFHDDYPMKNAALYFGWYSGSVAGPIAQPDFKFNRGALACHIHSNSAQTVRIAGAAWVVPLIEHGAAATMGNVYEPYLALTPNLDVFFDRLRNGFNFAESAYAAERGLSWQTTFVGDPLYQPFKVISDAQTEGAEEWRAYREGALLWFKDGRAAGEAKLQQEAKRLRSGIIYESLGLLERDAAGDPTAALAAFEQAQKFYPDASDVMRNIIHRVQTLRAANRSAEALALVRKQISKFPKLRATNVLRSIESELVPKPSPAPSP